MSQQIVNIKKDLEELKGEIKGLKRNLLFVAQALIHNKLMNEDFTLSKPSEKKVETTYPARTGEVKRDEERIERVH
jgi:hypothetical protein